MNKMLFLAIAIGLLILLSPLTQPARTQENPSSDRSPTVSLAAPLRLDHISDNEESTSPVLHSRITGFLAGVGLVVFVVANSKRRR